MIQTGDPQFVRYQDQSGSSQLSLGGGPRRGNGYLIEGVSITDLTNRPTIAPSMEAVEELKVQTKTYEADMGHAAGGVFNTTARSGSNTWHGHKKFFGQRYVVQLNYMTADSAARAELRRHRISALLKRLTRAA